jgi:phosphoglycerate kinase
MAQKSKDFLTLDDFDFSGKVVLLRLDLNSPIHPVSNEIMSETRFRSHIATIEKLKDSKLVILAHQSRPGKSDFTSLYYHAKMMERLLGRRIKFIDSLYGQTVISSIKAMSTGEIIMLENTRFFSEDVVIDPINLEDVEKTNFVKNLSGIADYFVNDAFPAIHRSQTSLTGFARTIPNIAGLLIQEETAALNRFLESGKEKSLAILAGAKIEDSITVAQSFLEKGIVKKIIVGGVVANAFMWSMGKKIGKMNENFIIHNNKRYENFLKICSKLLRNYEENIIMPVDFVLNPSGKVIKVEDDIPDDQIIADIGLESIAEFSKEIRQSSSIFINGPLGMYEIKEYSLGTFEILKEVGNSKGMKIAGGGHTISAIEALGIQSKIEHISTGGGALISYLSGETMPVLEALKESKKHFQR